MAEASRYVTREKQKLEEGPRRELHLSFHINQLTGFIRNIFAINSSGIIRTLGIGRTTFYRHLPPDTI